MPRIYKRKCDCCKRFYVGSGSKYCSTLCGKKGKDNPFFGKRHSKKTKKKIAKSRIGKSTGSGKKHWNWQGGKYSPKICPDCGKEMNFRSSYCSSCSKKGERSPKWKGGISPFRIKISQTNKYRQWRKDVFTRDKYICQDCNKKGGWIEAHHIKSFAEFPALRLEIPNGITLCKKCHKLRHTDTPKPKYS